MSSSLKHTERQQPEKKQRLVGLDLFRGIAAFAVAVMHADEGLRMQSAGWSFVLNFSAFAVPFFLAASFYLTVGKLQTDAKPTIWRTKLSRLLIPYAVWSLIYLSQDILRFVSKHQLGKLQKLFHNSLGLIVLGQTRFHLYFIPLLVTGILLVIAIEPLIRRRFKLQTLIGWVVASLVIYQTYRIGLDAISSNASVSGVGGLFGGESGLLFILLKVAGYAARCLPYVAIALLLYHPPIHARIQKLGILETIFVLILFGVSDGITPPVWLRAVHESLVGFSALLLAFALSHSLRGNPLIRSVGNCSFGIYLMHLVWVELCWSIIKRIGLTSSSILVPLGVATVGFTISWMITSRLMQQKVLARILFGASSI